MNKSTLSRIMIAIFMTGLFLSACASDSVNTDGVKSVTVTISNDGTMKLYGKSIDPDKLSAELKSEGITKDTTLYISIPKNVPTQTLTKIKNDLVRAGYGRFVFQTSRKAVAVIKGDEPAPLPDK